MTVSPGVAQDQGQPRGFVPIAFSLSSLPGFSDYAQTYSRVRILSCRAAYVSDTSMANPLPGAFFLAPSSDYVQAQLLTTRTVQDQGQPVGPAVVTFGVYDTIGGAGTAGEHGLRVQASVDGVKQSLGIHGINGPPINIDIGTSIQAADDADFRTYDTIDSARGENVANTRPQNPASLGLDIYQYMRSRATVRGLLNDQPVEATIQVPRQAATVDVKWHLDPADFMQLEQLKRFRVINPPTTTRKISFPIRWYGFSSQNGPYTRNGDMAQYPRYFSTKKFMPMQWFNTTEGTEMLLFGPFCGPMQMPAAATEPVRVTLLFHFRVQFAGQV